jgi:hypothetical protein
MIRSGFYIPLLVIVAACAAYHAFLWRRAIRQETNPRGSRRISIGIMIRCAEGMLLVVPWVIWHFGLVTPYSHIQSVESAAIGNLRTIVGAETAYRSVKGAYTGSWADMTGATPPFLVGDLSNPHLGYEYELTETEKGKGFEVVAVPHQKTSLLQRLFLVPSARGFFTNASGVIRWTADGLASKPSANSTPIGQN